MGLQGQYVVLPTGKWFSAAVNIYQPQSRTHKQTHTGQPLSHTHTHENTDTLGSATHKAVNNRKWYVAEKVSAQLDSANTALFFHSSFIFSVHVDMSSIFSACLEVLLHLKAIWVWLCIPLLLTSWLPQTSTISCLFYAENAMLQLEWKLFLNWLDSYHNRF